MTNPYPLPRETRETAPIAGDGRASYGPLGFLIWDVEDVQAVVSRDGGTWLPEAVTAAKVSNQPFDHFTVAFASPLLAGDRAVVQSRRLQKRDGDVTRGGAISGAALERELSVLGTIAQELRRDADRMLRFSPDVSAPALLPVPRPGFALVGNATGDGFENSSVPIGGGAIEIEDVDGLALALRSLTGGIASVVDSIGVADGIAELGPDGKVRASQLPSVPAPDLSGLQHTDEKGIAGGYAGLGRDGKVPVVHMPQRGKTFYVSDYVPAGETDDNRDRLIALADIVIAAGGGRIVVDRPVRVSGAWRFTNAADIEIVGEGRGSLELLVNASSAPIAAIRFIESTRCRVANLRIFAAANAARGNIGFATDAFRCSHMRMENLHCTNLMTGPWFGNCEYVWVSGCFIKDPRADGIHFAMGSRWCVGYGNHVEGQNDDCYASTSDVVDAVTAGVTPRRTQNIVWIGNTCGAGTWGNGIVAYESDMVLIADNIIRDVGGSGISVSLHDDPSAKCRDVIITGNIIRNPGRAQSILGQAGQPLTGYESGCGIFITDGDQVFVADNKIGDVTRNPSDKRSGIIVENSAQVVLKSNRIQNVDGFGIAMSGSCVDIDIRDNDIDYTSRSGISADEMTPGFEGSFVNVSDNHTRRTAMASGFSLNLNLVSAEGAIVSGNIDGSYKKGSIGAKANAIILGNFPALDGQASGGGDAVETSGSWTPRLRGSNGTEVGGYTSSGTWRKIGGIVFFQALFDITSIGGAAGALQISNMPFARDTPTTAVGVGNTNSYGVGGIVGAGGLGNPSVLAISRVDNTGSGNSLLTGNYNIGGVYSAA